MIIGIDESGTFSLESRGISLFAGVHLLRSQDKTMLSKKLETWKDKHRSLKRNNEIKGNNLSEDLCLEFVQDVLMGIDNLYITVCGTVPSEHKTKDIQFNRDHHVKSLDLGIQKCIDVGNLRLAKQ